MRSTRRVPAPRLRGGRPLPPARFYASTELDVSVSAARPPFARSRWRSLRAAPVPQSSSCHWQGEDTARPASEAFRLPSECCTSFPPAPSFRLIQSRRLDNACHAAGGRFSIRHKRSLAFSELGFRAFEGRQPHLVAEPRQDANTLAHGIAHCARDASQPPHRTEPAGPQGVRAQNKTRERQSVAGGLFGCWCLATVLPDQQREKSRL